MSKQLTAIDTTDDRGKAITSLYDSFFPVFSEKPYVIDVNRLTLYFNTQKIPSLTQNYTYNFEYFHFKPPIV